MTANSQPNTLIARAMLVMVAAMLFAPTMDAIAKFLATNFGISPATVTFSRFAVQSTFLGVFVFWAWFNRDLRFHLSWMNMLRGMIMGLAAMTFFTAVKYMPLADAIAVFFVEPLMVMLLSSVFLGEIVGWRRRIAALAGFSGALIVIQPSYELFGLVSLLPLCTAFLFSVYLILTRIAGGSDEPLVMQFFAGIGGALVCAAVLVAGTGFGIADVSLTPPQTGQALALLLSIGLIGTATHLLIVTAFSMAPASILAPFQYVEIVSATLFGLLLFGDFPNPLQWLGILVIIGSGIYIFLRERRLEQELV